MNKIFIEFLKSVKLLEGNKKTLCICIYNQKNNKTISEIFSL